MSADDHDDDDQLKSLRSVWVSMRESDEEPPDRGLAALMAAARTKADELKAPPRVSFWQRALAAFRRPPVLALASVTVLLGGALFIANRRDEMKAESTISVSREEQPRAAGPVAGSAAVAEPAAVETKTAPAVEPTPAPAPPPPQPHRKPAVRVTPKPPPPSTGALKDNDDDAKTMDTGLIGGADSPGAEPTGMAAPEMPEKADKKPATRAPIAKGEAQATDESVVDSRVQQLVKQCEVAAARGDCAAVRLLAGRIKSEDAAAYAQRVQKNTAIVRCLDAVAK